MNYSSAALAVETTEINSTSDWDWTVEPTSHKKIEGGLSEFQPRYTDTDQTQIRQKFRELAQRWDEETLNLSSLTKILSHEAYLAIIALGRPVLPFLFSELEQRPNFWFTAISSILRANNEYADVVDEADYGNLQKMTDAWVEWGREQGYLD